MAVAYGTRINDDTNFITTIDIDEETCETTGYIDGEAVDFSGGGGSSDFTTAEVTLITTDTIMPLPKCVCCVEAGEMGEGAPSVVGSVASLYGDQSTDTTKIYKVPLYNGACMWEIPNSVADVSGNIQDMGNGVCFITGDGSITTS